MANNTERVYLKKVCAGSLGGIFSPKPIEVFQSPRQALLLPNASQLLTAWDKVFRPSKLAKSKDTTFHNPSSQLTLHRLHGGLELQPARGILLMMSPSLTSTTIPGSGTGEQETHI